MSLNRLFAPLILLEQIHPRITAQLESLDSILSGIPVEHDQIIQAVAAAIQSLRQSLHTLETARLVCNLRVHQRLAVYLRRHGHLPAIADTEDFSDSIP